MAETNLLRIHSGLQNLGLTFCLLLLNVINKLILLVAHQNYLFPRIFNYLPLMFIECINCKRNHNGLLWNRRHCGCFEENFWIACHKFSFWLATLENILLSMFWLALVLNVIRWFLSGVVCILLVLNGNCFTKQDFCWNIFKNLNKRAGFSAWGLSFSFCLLLIFFWLLCINILFLWFRSNCAINMLDYLAIQIMQTMLWILEWQRQHQRFK